MSITRRLFLRQTAAVGAAVAVSAPAVAETQPPMSSAEQARWHLSQAHRLMEEATGCQWDLTLEDDSGLVLFIQRDRPSKWHFVRSPDGKRETHFCNFPAAELGTASVNSGDNGDG